MAEPLPTDPKPDGGPAFPSADGEGEFSTGWYESGMTLRVWLAARAPEIEVEEGAANVRMHHVVTTQEARTVARYRWADAMIAERDRTDDLTPPPEPEF